MEYTKAWNVCRLAVNSCRNDLFSRIFKQNGFIVRSERRTKVRKRCCKLATSTPQIHFQKIYGDIFLGWLPVRRRRFRNGFMGLLEYRRPFYRLFPRQEEENRAKISSDICRKIPPVSNQKIQKPVRKETGTIYIQIKLNIAAVRKKFLTAFLSYRKFLRVSYTTKRLRQDAQLAFLYGKETEKVVQ